MPATPHYSTRTSSTYDDRSTPSKPTADKLDVNTADPILPPPVVLSPASRGSGRRKRIRIQESATQTLKTQWDRLLRKFGAGTAPSASSVDFDAESVGEPGSVYGHYKPEWQRLEAADEIDEVVVEREWGEDVRASSVHSGHGEKSGSGQQGLTSGGDADSLAVLHDDAHCSNPIFAYLRYRLFAAIKSFFVTDFIDEKSEEQYRKESWFLRKNLALWSAGFFILNWLLSCIFVPKPITLADKIFHYGVGPVFTFPIFFMVLYDFPRDKNWIYQVILTISTWMWGVFQILCIYLCAYYGGHRPLMSCGSKDFLATFYYANGPQTIALFGLGLHRFPALMGTLTFMALSFGMVIPDRTTWVRNVINFLCYQAFLLYVHYMRENSERRLYTLRDQLKVQFRATQKAQVNERKAADSKRRLTSYVFHEVRVPLNTALLAVQNMAASGAIAKGQEIEFKALEGSLSMMSKVLNDVLDFNRMDSGRFESVSKPYPFHKVMRSLFVPLRMATDARGLSFVTELDKGIDEMSRKALYEAQGMSDQEAIKRMVEHPEEDGIVVGDETRLRQIITNLASNACKFTPAGGQLTITTRLIFPHRASLSRNDSETLTTSDGSKDLKETANGSPASGFKELGANEKQHPQLSYKHLERHNSIHSKAPPTETIVVRIEVSDTGCGIKPTDMVQCKLFSAFNQTEMGRQQGGKGTGLGLALVRQIVKLSGGRLGVQSKVGKGSTFWVELPLGVGSKATPYFTTPQFVPQTENAGHHRPGDYVHDHLRIGSADSKWSKSSSHRGTLPRTTSAMHTIMDQGGLVEISTDSNAQGQVLTRTLGDPSTGTDPTPSAPLTTPESSPAQEHPRPPMTTELLPDITVRPTFVQLPSRQRFSAEQLESFFDASGSASGSPIGTPSGSAHSSVGGWEMGMRVLVVDDDPLTRKLMSRMLTRLGCKVSTAENGEIALDLILGTHTYNRPTPSSEETGSAGLSVEALSSAGSNVDEYKYAIIFLDNQMPVLSGLDAVARLREMGRKDFVVGVTGNALLGDQQEYLEAGVDRVLTKPVYEKSLKTMLAYAEERRRRGHTPIAERPDPSAPP